MLLRVLVVAMLMIVVIVSVSVSVFRHCLTLPLCYSLRPPRASAVQVPENSPQRRRVR